MAGAKFEWGEKGGWGSELRDGAVGERHGREEGLAAGLSLFCPDRASPGPVTLLPGNAPLRGSVSGARGGSAGLGLGVCLLHR